MQGLPYETVNLGPPKPPCNDDRIATLRALDLADRAPDPELGTIDFYSILVLHSSALLILSKHVSSVHHLHTYWAPRQVSIVHKCRR